MSPSPSIPINHRIVSTTLIRSGATPFTRADSVVTDRTRLDTSANIASSFSTPSTVSQCNTSISIVILICLKFTSTIHRDRSGGKSVSDHHFGRKVGVRSPFRGKKMI
jgi:hypothetical protein